ncbi:MAG: bifunctional methylenetetrahydrofolate dehydrogenase/methenyltetrahydrofolate cyclohydrolase FolD [Simkaniaceae bacterium]|nr:bifunctional methylenetetrahydrofolate dehydrogenase/methenyltetrahydrofolate cyclohydrolase FolD [Simkaniaceae bacterium]MCF7851720.1 bifunctional methylenetetrahydrofolate dehydrogenase/methenyltetrahydrofolate cyclohydrolase FolD [Simkaniaceae bacterium]
MHILDGKAFAAQLRAEMKNELNQIGGRSPGLAFILIGSHPASHSYVSMKEKACHEVGITSKTLQLDQNISEKDLIEQIKALNMDPSIDGILIQQPFPQHLEALKIVACIDPQKDVDGFHPLNLGKLMIGDPSGFVPCTPLGILKLLEHYRIDAESKHVVIAGRSNIVGKPLASLLIQKKKGCNATVTVVHSQTQNIQQICSSADILIAAIGAPHLIKPDYVKEGAVVVDVGINRIHMNHQSKIVGDVDFDSVSQKTSYITPVPGGIGPMTIAMLLHNTIKSFKMRLLS